MQKEEKLQDKLKRLSDELAEFIYPLTFNFPSEEKFALADQIRRAALSVPTNAMEGLSRETDKDEKCFMILSISSLEELKYEVYFAMKRK
jgi:four helix bundle protein